MEGLLYFWSITRGGLCWEESLNGGTTVLLVYITSQEVVSGGRGLSMEGLLYFWSITRGGLWWKESLNGGTTVLMVYN